MPLTDERSDFQFICYLPAYLASIGVILPVILSLDVIFYWMSEQSADTLFSLVLQYEYIIKILAISGFLSSLMVRYLDKDEENVFRKSMRLLSIFSIASIATMGLLLVIMLVGVPYPRISTILALLDTPFTIRRSGKAKKCVYRANERYAKAYKSGTLGPCNVMPVNHNSNAFFNALIYQFSILHFSFFDRGIKNEH